jgi:hypothetical protein
LKNRRRPSVAAVSTSSVITDSAKRASDAKKGEMLRRWKRRSERSKEVGKIKWSFLSGWDF